MTTPEQFGVTLDEDLQQLWNMNETFVNEEIERLVAKNEVWSDFMEKLVEDQIKIVGLQKQRNAMGIVKIALVVFGAVVLVLAFAYAVFARF